MTYIKKILVLPVLVAMIFVIGLSAQNAMALTSSVNDKLSCESPSVGGVWTSITSTCTVATLVIGPGDTLVIASNVNFNIGTVTSSGVIQNDGKLRINNGGVITTSGTFTNNGYLYNFGGTITNSGPLNNFGKLISTGTITNGPTGTITSNGSISSIGTITTSGSIIITSFGNLANNGNGIITNSLNMVNNGLITTSGTFTNSGPVTNTGLVTNNGLITNSNTVTNTFGSIVNLCGGSITNSGTITGHPVNNICVA